MRALWALLVLFVIGANAACYRTTVHLSLRKTASQTAEKITTITAGDVVTRVGSEEKDSEGFKWWYVEYAGRRGYAAIDWFQPASCPGSNDGYEFVGCFADAAVRTMTGGSSESGTMDILTCFDFCKSKGTDYFGMQYRSQCYCSNAGYDSKGRSTACTEPCSGNPAQICGGAWANSVYRVLKAGGTPAPTSENQKIKCESNSHGRSTCSVGSNVKITEVRIDTVLSSSPCNYGYSYGVEAGTDKMWVDKGCRGQFIVYFTRNGGTTPTPAPAPQPGASTLAKCGDICPPMGAECWDAGSISGACNDLKCDLKIEHRPATNPKWKVVSYIVQGTEERAQGRRNIFVKLQKKDGSFYGENQGVKFTAFWGQAWDKPDNEVQINPKTNEWGDYPVSGTSWFPCTSKTAGPYGVYVGSRSSSDVVYGMGLPVNHHYSYYIIFREQ